MVQKLPSPSSHYPIRNQVVFVRVANLHSLLTIDRQEICFHKMDAIIESRGTRVPVHLAMEVVLFRKLEIS
jgi:hypothetical protein